MFRNENDIALLIFVDGFQPKHTNDHTMTIVHCLVMNISPSERHARNNMITFTITPGPSKPKDLMSFLQPILDEVKEVGTNGFQVKKNDAIVYDERAHIIGMTGDIPGVAELINHSGHGFYHGCRICDTLGVSFEGGVYFPNDGTARSLNILLSNRDELGMRGVSDIVSSLPTFSGVPFFCLDEMHLIGGGIAVLVFKFICPTSRHSFLGPGGYIRYFFRLNRELRSATGMLTLHKKIKKCPAKVPPSFKGSFQTKFNNYRAVDWQIFLLVVDPNILLPYIHQKKAEDSFMCIVNGCSLALNRTISKSQLRRMRRYLNDEIEAGCLNVSVFTSKNHYLSHMELMTRQMGPMKQYSCRSTERTIKTFTNRVRSTTHPGVNSTNFSLHEINIRQEGLRKALHVDETPSIGHESSIVLSLEEEDTPELWFAN
ncbi:hypothetical protein G6F56_005190 [Rhizopus delemar]|nr:hypothetical protein G6F56_005190 [Rhizopus delemar]